MQFEKSHERVIIVASISNSEMKRRKIVKILQPVMFVLLTVVAVQVSMLGAGYALGVDTPVLTVVSGSMRPTLLEGDLIIIQKADAESLNVGAIIVFHSPHDRQRLVVHRIVDVLLQGNETYFRTKGDNNSGPDPWLVPSSYVVGVLAIRVPYVGHLSTAIRTPAGITLIALLAAAILLLEIKRKSGENALQS